jgi:hypothetical protein
VSVLFFIAKNGGASHWNTLQILRYLRVFETLTVQRSG